jgi:hypothetical protein
MHGNPKLILASAVLLASILVAIAPAKNTSASVDDSNGKYVSVLWREPKDIASRNLYYGPGGKAHEPKGSFTFKEEDMLGGSPKFDVVDQDGVKWRVKMGVEARPETVASRLVWAVGYFANEDYFMPKLQVDKLPRLRRGREFVSAGGYVTGVRLKRHLTDEKKAGSWAWSTNPFVGTREWYGLRVLMAVINNWDLKDENNSIYLTKDEPLEKRYVVSDLGASFGSTGFDMITKGDPAAYCHSKFMNGTPHEFVNFSVPSRPHFTYYLDLPEMPLRLKLVWLGHHIPRPDARWMGDLLARLSTEQIHDAFRAGGYSPDEVEKLSQQLQLRIRQLEKL